MEVRHILLVVAAMFVVAGFALAWPPLGLIAAGVACGAAWWLTSEVDDAPR